MYNFNGNCFKNGGSNHSQLQHASPKFKQQTKIKQRFIFLHLKPVNSSMLSSYTSYLNNALHKDKLHEQCSRQSLFSSMHSNIIDHLLLNKLLIFIIYCPQLEMKNTLHRLQHRYNSSSYCLCVATAKN